MREKRRRSTHVLGMGGGGVLPGWWSQRVGEVEARRLTQGPFSSTLQTPTEGVKHPTFRMSVGVKHPTFEIGSPTSGYNDSRVSGNEVKDYSIFKAFCLLFVLLFSELVVIFGCFRLFVRFL